MTSSFLSAFDGLWRRPTPDYKMGVRSYLVSLDTNVLLQLYRFTPDARHELLDALGRLGDRLWVSHHVATEYFNRRVDAVKEHLALYTSVPKSLEEAQAKAMQELHTFAKRCSLSEAEKREIISPIDAAFTATLASIKRRKDSFDLSLDNVINADPILESLASILDGKTGGPFESDEAARLIEEAERRYENKVPPGFKDASKSENAHGDFFVWEQLLREAKSREMPALFVTNDVKEDWVRKEAGFIIGAHPQLVAEFKERCGGADFMVTPLGRFLQIAKEELGVSVSASTVAQAENIREAPRDQVEIRTVTPEECDSLILDLAHDAQKWDGLYNSALSKSSRILARHRRDRSISLGSLLEGAGKSRTLDGKVHLPIRSRDWKDIQAARRRMANKSRYLEEGVRPQERPKFSRDWFSLADMEAELDGLRRHRERLTYRIVELEKTMVEPSNAGSGKNLLEVDSALFEAIEERTVVENRISATEERISQMIAVMTQESDQ